MNKEEFLKIYSETKQKSILSRKDWHSKHKNIKTFLENYFNDIPKEYFKYNEVIYRLVNNITKRPVCLTCGRPVLFDVTKKYRFRKFCSYECSNSNSDKIKQQQETCLKNNGVRIPIQSESLKNKIKETNLKKYGNEWQIASDKTKIKSRQTLKNHFGKNIENPGQIESIKESRVKKTFETQRKRKTISSSKSEKELFKLLQKEFPDVINQYYDSVRYKHNCDFYIPSLDLFIEWNGSKIFHNTRLFRNSVKDQVEAERIRRKISGEKPRYERLLSGWTKSDPLKYKEACQSNINYLLAYPDAKLEKIVEYAKKFKKESHMQIIIGEK